MPGISVNRLCCCNIGQCMDLGVNMSEVIESHEWSKGDHVLLNLGSLFVIFIDGLIVHCSVHED